MAAMHGLPGTLHHRCMLEVDGPPSPSHRGRPLVSRCASSAAGNMAQRGLSWLPSHPSSSSSSCARPYAVGWNAATARATTRTSGESHREQCSQSALQPRIAVCMLLGSGALVRRHYYHNGLSRPRLNRCVPCAVHKAQRHAYPGVPPELERYEPQQFQDYFLRRPSDVIWRCFDIFIRGAVWAQDFARHRHQPSETKRLAWQLCEVLTALGPSFVKLGQVFSSRVDLVPPEYVEELGKLTDRVLPFSRDKACEILQEDWVATDAPFPIQQLPELPAASASLGQVYRVVTARDGVLAVKVQRPGAREQVCLDLFVLRTLAPLLRGWLRLNTDLLELVDEYGARFVDEMNYVREAEDALAFQQGMSRLGLDSVSIAEPRLALTTGRVLVTRWVDGLRIDGCGHKEGTRLCGIALTAYLTMLLETGRLHADPHPGNLLRAEDGRLCILDWGLVTTVEPHQRDAIIAYITHLLAEDWSKVPDDLVRLGFITMDGKRAVYDDAEAAKAISAVFRGIASGGSARKRVRDVIPEIQAVRRRYGNIGQIPAYFTYILRSFSVLEGIGLGQDPSYSIASGCYPFMVAWLLRADPEKAQQVLEALVYQPQSDIKEPLPKGIRAPLSGRRILRLLDALENYTTQAAAPSEASASSKPSADDDGLSQIISLLLLLSRSEACQDLAVIEAARTLDVVLREALEMSGAAGHCGVVGAQTAEDKAVLASLQDLVDGILARSSSVSRAADFFSKQRPQQLQQLIQKLLAGGRPTIDAAVFELCEHLPEIRSAIRKFIVELLRRAAARLDQDATRTAAAPSA
eukprot:TRINITY_DN82024_c0_g1_i1.p1 TRINITY_DN82024_c0_g1~~TRINITY_DN82024_c0_g1_i1.p1  ORF type:complete len:806 (-),score=101.44 TRINITY_DN82024_c0_g1_i1:202-2619(-)